MTTALQLFILFAAFILEVFPSSASDNTVNRGNGYAKISCHHSLTFSSFMKNNYFGDFFFTENGISIISSFAGSVPDSILRIVFVCTPTQIFQPVIFGIPIREVADFHPPWARTDKGFKNESVNEIKLSKALFENTDRDVIKPLITKKGSKEDLREIPFDSLFGSYGPGKGFNPAEVGDFVQTFKSNNRLPNFFRHNSPRISFNCTKILEVLPCN